MEPTARPNSYRVEGDVAYVELTKGQEAVIDALDLPLILPYRWQAEWSNATQSYYVRSRTGGGSLLMQRVIADPPAGSQTHFRNGNTLDCRRGNLENVPVGDLARTRQGRGTQTIRRSPRVEGDRACIPLTKGYEAIIDAADAPMVSDRNWCIQPNQAGQLYAASHWRPGDPEHLKSKGPLFLHRFLTAAPKGKVVDHINHDTLDNRRENLLVCSARDNSFNRRAPGKANRTGFRGVSVHTGRRGEKYYVARVTVVRYFPHTEEGLQRAVEESKRLHALLRHIDLWDALQRDD